MPFSQSLRFLYSEKFALPIWGILLVLLLLGSWGTWIFFVEIPLYSVTHTARIEVLQSSYPIHTTIDGKVIAVPLKLGQNVKAGAVLLQLDDSHLHLQKKQLQKQHRSILAQIDNLQRKVFHFKKLLEEHLQVMMAKSQEDRASYQEKKVALQLAEEEFMRFKQLYNKQNLSHMELMRSRSKAQELKAALQVVESAITRSKHEFTVEQREYELRLNQLQQELLESEEKRDTIATEIEKIGFGISRHKVCAPVDGSIVEVGKIHAGMFLEQGHSIASMLPRENSLRVVASFAPVDAIGKVYPEQRAYLQLQGFPALQYGKIAARVERVSQEPRDGRIQVILRVERDNPLLSLQHGLPTQVEIETTRISPAKLVLRKIGMMLQDHAVE